jgi:hypothetical protein
MEKLEIEYVKNKNFPSKDTTLSQKDIWSLIDDLMLAPLI